jgi:hypothetical protein
MRVYRSDTGGDGFMTCDPGLPNRALVTKVQFTVFDDDINASVRYCALVRVALGVTTAGNYVVMAEVPSTGNAETPGLVRPSATLIADPMVDHKRFGYFLQCQLDGFAPVGLYGANVIYTISAVDG